MNYEEAKHQALENFKKATANILNWDDLTTAELMVVNFSVCDAVFTGYQAGSADGLQIGLNSMKHFSDECK